MRLSIVGQRAAATLRGDRGRIRPLESRHHSELHDCACGGGPQGHVGPIVVASITPDAAPGLVASLARPGGNVTASRHRTLMSPAGGSSCCAKSCPTCAGWRTDYVYAMEMDVLQAAARTFGLETVTLKIRRGADITPAFEGLKALFVSPEPLAFVNRVRINTPLGTAAAYDARHSRVHRLRRP